MKNVKIHSVKYNFAMNFVLNAAQMLFPLITFPYISRVLMADGNGKISFAASVASYFMLFASLGIPTYGVRACAQVRDDKEKLSRTVHEIFFINFLMTTVVSVIYFVCVFTVPIFKAEKTLFLINAVNIVLNMFGMNWLFQALEQYDYITIRSLLFKIVSVMLMFLLVHTKEDYVVYASITVFAAVGSNILNFVRVRSIVESRWMGAYELKRHLKPIGVLFAQSLAVSIYTNLDTVMLGFLKTDVEVGYYNAAIKIKIILLSFVTSLCNVLLPRMTYYAKKQLHTEFENTTMKALNATMLMAVPLVTFFVLFASETINFLAGSGYAGAVLAMQIITVAVIPNGLTGVLGIQVLTALEKEKLVFLSVVVGALTDFILNLFFIPAYGASGAAFATMIAEFAVLAVQISFTRDLLRKIQKGFKTHIYILLAAFAGLISLQTKQFPIHFSFISLLLATVVFFAVYAIGLVITREPLAKEILFEVMGKLRRKRKNP